MSLDETGTPDSSKPIKYAGVVAGAVADKGIGGMVSLGLHLVFGSLLGSSSSTANLSFPTNGKVTLKGTITTPLSGMISPIAGLKLGSPEMELGLWNLTTKPSYTTQPSSELLKSQATAQGTLFYYYINRTINVNLVTNPNVSGNFTTSNSAVIYEKYKGETTPLQTFSFGNIQTNRATPETVIYADEATRITTCSNRYLSISTFWPNGKTTKEKVAARLSGSNYDFIDDNAVIRVLVKHTAMINGENTTFYSMKSFLPDQFFSGTSARPYTWTKNELTALGFPN